MSKLHQIGAFCYIGNESMGVVDHPFDAACEQLWFQCDLHRLRKPSADEIKVIYHRPGTAGTSDPLDQVGSVGYKARVPRLPWYQGWGAMLRAWWSTRRWL